MDSWRPFVLLIAGGVVSVLGRLLLPSAGGRTLCALVILLVLLLSIGSGLFGVIFDRTRLWRRRNLAKHLVLGKWKVGILNDLEWESTGKDIAVATTVSPQEWKTLISGQAVIEGVKLRIKMPALKRRRSLDSFHVILNPYGEVYPEYDVMKYETLDKIFDYVRKGGVFVNVAGIAGYYLYNPALRRRLDAANPVYQSSGSSSITPVRPFWEVPFSKRLGLQIFNVDNWGRIDCVSPGDEVMGKALSQMGKITIRRVALIEGNVTPIATGSQQPDTTPIFSIPYGEGTFLMSLVFLNEENRFKEIVTKCVISMLRSSMR
jgi:hypothetical protein